MQVNYYRQGNAQGYEESWQACQFTADTDLSAFTARALVTINNQPFIRQHHVTYLTGKETSRAHHFAKHLAIQVLEQEKNGKVLWIDTCHGTHVSAAICREIAAHARDKHSLHFICLDVLGSQRDDVYWLTRSIENLIGDFKPSLVVIDNIDHFMPHCGINIASEFCNVVRDFTNHSETAFLLIGYNNLGKKASTTGNLGKLLFTAANDIFVLSTVRNVTTVRHVCGYDLRCNPDESQFQFTIGHDNLPVEANAPTNYKSSSISDDTLRDIVEDLLTPGQTIGPGEFIRQVNARHREIKQQNRDAALLNQALRLNLIELNNNDKSHSDSSVDRDNSTSQPTYVRPVHSKEINNPLTLPPLPKPAITKQESSGPLSSHCEPLPLSEQLSSTNECC